MNIFEQYGIKEVADCTLYAIALDRYDDEIYIPLMYFDTLKVSSIEQTASDTSAHGGIGNPNLITWDFGKEINVSLEDALYTPASQSLMWGGKFGLDKTRIKGFWNPIYFEKDEEGKEIYYDKEEIDEKDITEENSSYVYQFICPCTDELKTVLITPKTFNYKYTSEYLGMDNSENIIYTYISNKGDTPVKYSCNNFLPSPPNNGQPAEKATLILKNFSTFRFSEKRKTDEQEGSRYVIKEITSTDSSKCVPWAAPFSYISKGNEVLFDYEWLDCEVQMTSQQGNQDVYYAEHVDILIRTDSDGFNKKILIKNHNDGSYYNSQLDFFKKTVYAMGSTTIVKEIKVGTFYINDDFNFNTVIQDSFYSIEDGIEDVPYLDRMEKGIAKQTFCINTDQNTVLSYYKDLPQYKHSKLTVYIDPKTMKAYEPNSDSFQRKDGTIVEGNLRVIKQNEVYYKWTRSEAPQNTTLGHQIIVDSKHFPGTFRLVGETMARRRRDGKDERFQFEIPLCKLAPTTSLTLQADGDPTTFTMDLKVLQRSDGVMMKLTQYEVDSMTYNGQISGSNKIIPSAAEFKQNDCIVCEEPTITIEQNGNIGYEIILPYKDSYYCVPIDCLYPYTDGEAYLMLPKTMSEAETIYEAYEDAVKRNDYSDLEKYRNILLVKAQGENASIFINNQLYKIINSNIDSSGNYLVNAAGGVQFTIALGGGS